MVTTEVSVLKARGRSRAADSHAAGAAKSLLIEWHDVLSAPQGGINVASAPDLRFDGRGTAGCSAHVPIAKQARLAVQFFKGPKPTSIRLVRRIHGVFPSPA